MAWNRHTSLYPVLLVLMAICCRPLQSAAQIVIIPQEKLDSIARPQLDVIASALEFDCTVIDAGRISEDDGPQTYIYGFRNISRETVEITRLVTNCSCVVANSTPRWIGPGEKASIKVTYHPEGHPGTFERTVRVYARKVLPEQKNRTKRTEEQRLRLAAFLKLKIRVSEGTEQNR